VYSQPSELANWGKNANCVVLFVTIVDLPLLQVDVVVF